MTTPGKLFGDCVTMPNVSRMDIKKRYDSDSVQLHRQLNIGRYPPPSRGV